MARGILTSDNLGNKIHTTQTNTPVDKAEKIISCEVTTSGYIGTGQGPGASGQWRSARTDKRFLTTPE